MKDLHIVIVSWNVREELERCLKSLPEACKDLDWECVVVDNNSKDGSSEMVEKVFSSEDRIDLLQNKDNLGFAAACNQGAVQHKSRHILLLNPDTICPPLSLTELVRKMDLNPKTGIMGPKLLNTDGTYQQSVRSFPGLCSQILILLKIHHFFPWFPCLKKYFEPKINPNKPQSVDQVMGACFLVRAECWDEMHGLDQRYFIWFEEVDACKNAKKNGWLIWYEPTVAIMHHSGRAFSKALTVKKQRYFNDSLRKYMLKWHGRLAWLIISIFHPISLLLAGVVSIFKEAGNYKEFKQLQPKKDKPKIEGKEKENEEKIMKIWNSVAVKETYLWILCIFVLEVVSFLIFDFTVLRTAFTLLLGIVIAYLAYKKPAFALAVVATEILIGGFGYLFAIKIPDFPMSLSLRMVFLAGFGMGWGINALNNKVWQHWKLNELFIVQIWILIGIMFFSGTANGIIRGNPFVFEDANAWLFLLYFIPVLDIAHRYGKDIIRFSKSAFIASVIYLPLKALLVFYIFTHGIAFIAEPLYTWIRDTRVGEITPAGGNLYRVFFQSAIFSISLLLFVLAYWINYSWNSYKGRLQAQNVFSLELPKYGAGILWVLSSAMLIISLSRSFWLGVIASLLVVFVLGIVFFRRLPFIAIAKSLFGTLMGFALVAGIMYLPWPKTGDLSLTAMIKERGNITDAAGSSRWNLMPAMLDKIALDPIIGNGLGAVVTYKSLDPRVLQDNPDGLYTTYAFEWGWLGFWLKFGLFGPIIMLLLLISLAIRSYKSHFPWWVRCGMITTLLSLSIVHFFTPYLDHPLGFAVLLCFEGMLAIGRDIKENYEYKIA